MQKSLKRSIRRENVEKHYRRRYKIYYSFWRLFASGNEEKPKFHFLKTTGRPCSCWLCKSERYKRSAEKRKLIMN